MTTILITAPSVEPVTLDEQKLHSNIFDNDKDTFISESIIAAREFVEDFTQRAIVTQTHELKLDSFTDCITIPKGNLQSVESIKYIDTDGVLQTLSTSIYTVDTASSPGRVVLAYNQSWPTTRDVINSVTIRFVCGYGLATSVPKSIKSFILNSVNHAYEHTTIVSELRLAEDPVYKAENYLSRYRLEIL